ncbi:MAG: hypothetical protein ACRD0U_20650, partial [Acidimicrobiales bacterium]
MGAAGWYVFVYLHRWEWNRALISGVIFLAAEVGLIGVLLLDRLARVERRLEDRGSRSPEPDRLVLQRLRDTAPPPHQPFAWLTRDPERLSVFVPVLLGAGAVLSSLAWVVERLARMTSRPLLERGLARRLDSLALPPGGLLGDDQPDLLSPLP